MSEEYWRQKFDNLCDAFVRIEALRVELDDALTEVKRLRKALQEERGTDDSRKLSEAMDELWQVREALPDDLRAAGWVVAVHNDYRLNGEPHTFWLFTKEGRAIKGEGKTDAKALAMIRATLRGQNSGESESK